MEARAAEATAVGHTAESEWAHSHAAHLPFAAYSVTCEEGDYGAGCVLGIEPSGYEQPHIAREGLTAIQQSFADLLRDIVGDPFRPSRVHPAWLAWNDGTVPKLARAIYD